MSKTDLFEIDFLKLCVGKATTMFVSTPITPYIGLQTVTSSDSTEGTEASGNAYARQSMPAANWATPSAGSVANTTACLFPAATPGGYTVVSGSLHSAVSGASNMLRWADINPDVVLAINDQINFAIGAITFTED
jgi:hypothetical protein